MTTEPINTHKEMTNSEIEFELRSNLSLYTSLWFATQTDQYMNLSFTAVLMRLQETLRFMDQLKRRAVLGY